MLGHMIQAADTRTAVPQRDERRARHARLWRQWQRGDLRARERLIESLMPLVDTICHRRAQAGLPAFMETDDMASAAYVALIRAVEKYDPRAGASIESFVWNRCEGAVIDWMRGEFPGSRGLRDYERRRETLRGQLGREPSDGETAEALELTDEQVRRRELERVTRWTVSLSETLSDDADDGAERAEFEDSLIAHDRRQDPAAAAELHDTTRVVLDAVQRLPENERVALVGASLQEAPLRLVGEELGVSESRVCQLRAKAFRRLHDDLEPHAGLARAA
jgi:RNA polymerase sigma factor for flagellar operon FliA